MQVENNTFTLHHLDLEIVKKHGLFQLNSLFHYPSSVSLLAISMQ